MVLETRESERGEAPESLEEREGKGRCRSGLDSWHRLDVPRNILLILLVTLLRLFNNRVL